MMKAKIKKNAPKLGITVDRNNIRVHNERSQEAIRSSFAANGAGRSILIDSQNVTIGGNESFLQSQELGFPIRIIDTDGSELIAVRRTDLKTNDPKRKALAIADNRTTDLSYFNDSALLAMLDECDGISMAAGFTDAELEELRGLSSVLDDLEGNSFANNIKAMSDVFSITFVFPKAKGNVVPEYIKAHGKEKLTSHLIDYCKKAVN